MLEHVQPKKIIDYKCDSIQNSMITKIKRVVLQLAEKLILANNSTNKTWQYSKLGSLMLEH